MIPTSRIFNILKVRPGEERQVAQVLGLMLAASIGGSVGGNGIEALFFARQGVGLLPVMYMALGALTLVVSLAVGALLGWLGPARLYLGLPAALALALCAGRALLSFDLPWLYPALWLGMAAGLTLQGMFTWGLASGGFDTRQAKRLFPLFGAGSILGSAAGGLITAPLVAMVGSENLLLVWAAALAAVFGLGRALTAGGRGPQRRAAGGAARLIREVRQGFAYVRGAPLLNWLSWASIAFAVLYFSLTLPFARQAAAAFPDADALAGFLGLFQGVSTGAAFLASLFLANRLFARFGVPSQLQALALIYLAGFAALALLQFGSAPAALLFPALVAFRLAQMGWIQGVTTPAYQALLNVVPRERRDQVRAFIDGVPGQAGIFIAGGILFVGEQALEPRHMLLVGLAAGFAAVLITTRVVRAYRGALAEALRTGRAQVFVDHEEPFGGLRRDAAAVAAAVAGLASPDVAVRRVAAEVLGSLGVPQAAGALTGALADSDPQVRAHSLRGLGTAGASGELSAVTERLGDPEPQVRLAAVEALGRLAGQQPGAREVLRARLDDPASLVQAQAALELLRAGPEPRARDLLRNMTMLGDPDARVCALKALGEWGDVEAFELARVELEDQSAPASARRMAAAALARIDPERAIPPLVQALGDRMKPVRRAAAQALGRAGPRALDPVTAALSDPQLEDGALEALEHLPVQPAGPALEAYFRSAADKSHRYADCWLRLEAGAGLAGRGGEDERVRLLAEALRDQARRSGRHAIRAAGLMSDRALVALALEGLDSRDPGQRANALESLESLDGRWREALRPLLAAWEADPPAAGRGRASEGLGQQPRLLDLLADADAWVRASAVMIAEDSDDPPVQAALSRMAAGDSDPVVREAAGRAASREGGEQAMETAPTLSVMERVLFLRKVPLFSGLPPADLTQIAGIAGEQLYPDGELIARQGEPGDQLYIITSGQVAVLAEAADGRREVARRGPGEYVGEMAVITQEPRSATLAAAGEVRLLCIGRAQFEEILAERPETGLAVMRMLIARLKEAQAARPA
jgi:HEAT repeat protein